MLCLGVMDSFLRPCLPTSVMTGSDTNLWSVMWSDRIQRGLLLLNARVMYSYMVDMMPKDSQIAALQPRIPLWDSYRSHGNTLIVSTHVIGECGNATNVDGAAFCGHVQHSMYTHVCAYMMYPQPIIVLMPINEVSSGLLLCIEEGWDRLATLRFSFY